MKLGPRLKNFRVDRKASRVLLAVETIWEGLISSHGDLQEPVP